MSKSNIDIISATLQIENEAGRWRDLISIPVMGNQDELKFEYTATSNKDLRINYVGNTYGGTHANILVKAFQPTYNKRIRAEC